MVNKIVEQFLPTTAKQGNQGFLTYSLEAVAAMSAPARRASALAGHDSGLVHGDFSAARGGAEPGLGRDQEPQLSVQSAGRIWTRDLMVVLAMGSVLLSTWQRQLLGLLFFHHTDNFVFDGISYLWLAVDDGRGVDPVLLFDLLAAAQPPDSGTSSDADVDRHRRRLAGCEGRLCGRLAAPGSEGALRTVLRFRGPAVLGIYLGLILFAGAQFSAIPPLEKTAKK